MRRRLAFAIIYFAWGSTYPAVRVAVREAPPFLPPGSGHFGGGEAECDDGDKGGFGSAGLAGVVAQTGPYETLLPGLKNAVG